MPDAVIPIGLLQVMAAVPERHEKLFWDLCFEDDPLATVARNLRDHAPDLVAIGPRNIQNMDYTNITVNLDYYWRLVATVRVHSSAPVVLGGGGFSVIPEEKISAHTGVEHVFIVDSVFNLPPRHAKAVCRKLVARGNRTPWTSYVNPIAFDDELAGLMLQAGAAGMEVGSDTGVSSAR